MSNVDSNGFIHEGNEHIIVSTKGKIIKSSEKRFIKFHPTPPPATAFDQPAISEDEFLKLEDAIYAHGHPYIHDYLQCIRLVESATSWSADSSLKRTALRHCWNVMKWRPSHDGQRVLKKVADNPYTK